MPGTPLPQSRQPLRVGLTCILGASAVGAAAAAEVQAAISGRQSVCLAALAELVAALVAEAALAAAARAAVTAAAAPEGAREAARAVARAVVVKVVVREATMVVEVAAVEAGRPGLG